MVGLGLAEGKVTERETAATPWMSGRMKKMKLAKGVLLLVRPIVGTGHLRSGLYASSSAM